MDLKDRRKDIESGWREQLHRIRMLKVRRISLEIEADFGL
jgi:hypothetical protein